MRPTLWPSAVMAIVFAFGTSPRAATLTLAWTAESEEAYSEFGRSVASAGDVNGDGYDDVIVGAPYATGPNGHPYQQGRAYVFLGSASGLAATPVWTVESGQESSRFGACVATAGDVNGDGYDDVLVGAPFYNDPGDNMGRVFLYLGSATGPAATPAWTKSGANPPDRFGHSVATAGDVNGDGYADVIVGAPQRTFYGAAYVYLGSPAGLAATPVWTVAPSSGSSGSVDYGSSVGSAGDLNGDGYDEIVVGEDGPRGRALVYRGSASGPMTAPLWVHEVSQAGAHLVGMSVGSAGDVNGDGHLDLLVGAHAYHDGQLEAGKGFAFLGTGSSLAATPAWTVQNEQAGANLLWSVVSAGDVNGDGYADVLVTAPFGNALPAVEGEARAYLGSPLGVTSKPVWLQIQGPPDAHYGSSAASAGDVNGDGYADVVVGAPFANVGVGDEGLAFVYHGSGEPIPAGRASGYLVFKVGDGVTLEWANGGACFGTYAVYEGALGDFASHVPITCHTGTGRSWNLTPQSGDRYFLLVPTSVGYEGSYGLDGDGEERPASADACFPQVIADCF